MTRTVTALLNEWRRGDASAADELLPLVYDELRKLAASHMRRERAGHTFTPTDLVSEAYVRLARSAPETWDDRVHFFAIAARVMRQILVDHARRRGAGKRSSGGQKVVLDDAIAAVERPAHVLALDDALQELAKFDERKARAIELIYFGGMSQDEVAAVLKVSVTTVARDVKVAEAWIRRQMAE
jgi:RNA polymerase sigma factor (TIGR02999 family)